MPPPGGENEELVLASPVLMEGGVLPLESSNPNNESPALSWTAGPANARSYAVALTALQGNTVLWVMWDIPPDVKELPADISRNNVSPPEVPGAQQRNFQGTPGYTGPSANLQASGRMYRFDVWALEVDTLDVDAILGGGGGVGGGGAVNAARTAALVEEIEDQAIRRSNGSITVSGNRGN